MFAHWATMSLQRPIASASSHLMLILCRSFLNVWYHVFHVIPYPQLLSNALQSLGGNDRVYATHDQQVVVCILWQCLVIFASLIAEGSPHLYCDHNMWPAELCENSAAGTHWVSFTNSCIDYLYYTHIRTSHKNFPPNSQRVYTHEFVLTLVLILVILAMTKWVAACMRLVICIKYAQTISI